MKQQEEIKYNGVELVVVGKYYPPTPPRYYYPDGSGHPGDPAEFELLDIFWNEQEISELLIAFAVDLEDLEEKCIELVSEWFEP